MLSSYSALALSSEETPGVPLICLGRSLFFFKAVMLSEFFCNELTAALLAPECKSRQEVVLPPWVAAVMVVRQVPAPHNDRRNLCRSV